MKARTLVRVEEARESVKLIEQAVGGAASGTAGVAAGSPLPAFEPAFCHGRGMAGRGSFTG